MYKSTQQTDPYRFDSYFFCAHDWIACGDPKAPASGVPDEILALLRSAGLFVCLTAQAGLAFVQTKIPQLSLRDFLVHRTSWSSNFLFQSLRYVIDY
ncbi:MAG: hypothetical protein EOP04_03370 [Proteobacteria bacterium]|nr:MAG: hypothetical protein EOP04_03370 [Pseudomonadota bacterium]